MQKMEDFQEIYIPQKLKAFMSEPQGCAVVAALETQFQCSIAVVNDLLTIGNASAPVDGSQIETILRDVWQKRDVQLMIREAALNVSCTHTCQTILPRAYCAVVFFFSADLQRRSRCNDIIIDQFSGKLTIFGAEQAVNTARDLMIECLTEHFGSLEIDIPATRRTTRIGYISDFSGGPFNAEVSPPPFIVNDGFQIGEPNAILTSTPPPPPAFDELFSNFENHLIFPTSHTDFSVPPPQPPPTPPKTNNVEKIKHWIPSDEIGKILGNRAATKKQIEAQFNCVITVHTEVYSRFGTTCVEIMAQNKEQAKGARDAIVGLLKSQQEPISKSPSADSGVNSPGSIGSSTTTPEKRCAPRHYHRSSFRDQPKVMLALTPRKLSSPID